MVLQVRRVACGLVTETDDGRGTAESGWRLPAGAATGVGSLPGTDIAEAMRIVLGELPDLAHLPELPARGPGADLIGRGAGLLTELPVDVYAGRWRFAARPGRDLRRTRDLLERDSDEMVAQAGEYTGTFKVQAAGPWTLAAHLQLPAGGPALRDPGAVRDLAASLADGLAAHVADSARRLPHAQIVLQLDEPSLPAVLAGDIATESGLSRIARVAAPTAEEVLREVIDAAGVPVVVHCCASDVPVALVRGAGAAAVGLDLALLPLDSAAALDPLGEALDAGLALFAGAVPSSGGRPDGAAAATRIGSLWRRIGFPAERLPEQVVVTPACGLAGADPAYARQALTACREAGRRLADGVA